MYVTKSNKPLKKNSDDTDYLRLPQSDAARTAVSLAFVGSVSFLGGLIYGLICPAVQPDSTSAESASTEVTASIDDIIAISAPTSASITITPKADSSTFATTSVDVSVTTNNTYGYQLTMGTSGTNSSGSLTTSLISNSTSGSTTSISIPSITTSISDITTSDYDDFTDNAWGFTTNNNGADTSTGQIVANTYNPLTTTASPTLIKSTDSTATADTTTVTFAVKVNNEQAAGTYTNTVVFSATANPDPEPLAHISTMQEMTSNICSANPTYEDNGKTYTLTDTRDSKKYAIRKLADGNCWMVQNLALGVGTALSSNDTDIESASTYAMPTSDTTNFTVGTNPQYSGDNNNEMHTGIHIDGYVASVEADSLYSSDLTDTGNWYSWYVATAGTGTNTMSSGEATSSICPKGWKLPTGTESGQFYTLYTAYGKDQATLNAIFPLQLAGNYNFSGLSNSGSLGYWWSSTAASTAIAYGMGASTSGIYPGNNGSGYKYNGFLVRCVAASS